MKQFEDGETVVYYNPGHRWHLMNFKAYKSQYTENAYRLKYGEREVVADVSEIKSLSEHNGLLISEINAPRDINGNVLPYNHGGEITWAPADTTYSLDVDDSSIDLDLPKPPDDKI